MSHEPLIMNEVGSGNVMASMMGLVSSVKEEGDGSGTSAAFPEASESPVSESDNKTHVSSMFKREHLWSVSVFFGIGEERPFYVECTRSLLKRRLRRNIMFFGLNYMLVTAVLFGLSLIISPSAFLSIVLLACAWMCFIRASSGGSLNIANIQIPQKTATIGMTSVSVVVLLYILSYVFWWTLFWSGFLTGTHALLRDAYMADAVLKGHKADSDISIVDMMDPEDTATNIADMRNLEDQFEENTNGPPANTNDSESVEALSLIHRKGPTAP